jgi:hypothetical protein
MQRQTTINSLLNNISNQNSPLFNLRLFLEQQKNLKDARDTERMRFVGYVLEIGYDKTKIITSDPYKIAVGGIPRGSFLIMVPNDFGKLPYHFILLRVTGVATTPLRNQEQQTYFELHKKPMPELDIWIQNDLQWGALDCNILGMFYPNPNDSSKLMFSGDVNNVVSPHRYEVFAPDDTLLDLIVNGIIKDEFQFEIGKLRPTECQLTVDAMETPVIISMKDFMGCRTAMFGKTRLGKSNVVKLLAQGMIEATAEKGNVGQLIFDINGEYANDNDQDGNMSLRSAYADHCFVYALVPRPETPSKPLRLNFYEQPKSCIEILGSLLQQNNKTSNYIQSFSSVKLPSIEEIMELPKNERTRPIRKIQMYWAILKEAGFDPDTKRLLSFQLKGGSANGFNPQFNKELRKAAYEEVREKIPENPNTLDELIRELKVMANFVQKNPRSNALISKSSGKPIFDADDKALLNFLSPTSGSGPSILRAYQSYHDPHASDFANEIIDLLDQGKTVILDLGNATDEIRRYFADMLSRKVFSRQEEKFVTNSLGEHYVQLYFEEAHNLFPPDDKEFTGVYTRFAKEGAKFHIGMIYSTQSPSTINKELLIQTENFFVGHLSSSDEVNALVKNQNAYAGIEDEILKTKTPGYMRMLTLSHRFVIPVQTPLFKEKIAKLKHRGA